MTNDVRFDVEDKSYFIRMDSKATNESKKIHNKAFAEALANGALLRKALMSYMNEQGVWDADKEVLYQKYVKQINELEYKLSAGKMKVSEGKAIALELAKVRSEFRDLIAERNAMDSNTAEGQADNVRFNFLVSKCVYDWDTQKPVYSSLEDYTENGNSELAIQLANKFANFLYGVDEDYDNNLVENKFLRRFKIIDDKGRFINSDGKYVDIEGNLLDEEGYRLDSDGKRVDINGHPLDVDIDTAEFEEG
jgi:hypothetical protein